MSKLKIKVLGTWEVTAGPANVRIPSGQLRTVLSSLVVAGGQPVSGSTLAEQLWGEQQPSNTRGTVYTYMTRLRRLLGDNAISSDPGSGYSLAIDEEDIDLQQFLRLLRQAKVADSFGDELVLLQRALELWRGDPFTGVDSNWLEQDVVPALTEQWFTATERRIDLDLERGLSSELIAELWELTNKYSDRESLWVRLINVLHKSGRRADALAAYDQVRRILLHELGIDPGAELQELHQMVLHDRPPTQNVFTRNEARTRPHQLPHDNAKFVGRENDLATLDNILATDDGRTNRSTVIVAIDGAAGMGKTTLAIHWAHRVVEHYPDIQLYCNMRGYSAGEPVTPAAAMESMLRSLDVPIERIPAELEDRSALLRSTLAGRRALILLDNVRDTAQIGALIPGTDSLVIVTSRNQLRALTIRDGARRLTLRRLSHADAMRLLVVASGRDRVAGELEAAGRLADMCEGLPLALAIVAERAQRMDSLSEVVTALGLKVESLEGFGLGTEVDLHAALSWSYHALEPKAAALFRMLGLHPANDISLNAAAVLVGLPVSQAEHALDQLVEAHMVERRRDRYELHDLIRLYAAEEARRTEGTDHIEATIERILDWYLHGVNSADQVLNPLRRRDFLAPYATTVLAPQFNDQAQAIDWIETEFECLRSVVRWSATQRWGGHAWRIVIAMTTFLDRRIAWREGAEMLDTAIEAAKACGDRAGEGYSLNSLACLQIDTGELAQAQDNLEQALVCFKETDNVVGEMLALTNLGIVLSKMDNQLCGLTTSRKALDLARRLGHRRGVANNLDNIGTACSLLGEHQQAIGSLLQANAIFVEVDDPEATAYNFGELGRAYAAAGMPLKSVGATRKGIRLFQQLGNRRWQALLLYELGRTLHAMDHPALASECWQAALPNMREFADARARQVEKMLADQQLVPRLQLHSGEAGRAVAYTG